MSPWTTLVGAWLMVCAALPGPGVALRRVATVRLERAGYGFAASACIDTTTHRIYVCYTSADAVVAIDTRTLAEVGRLGGLRSIKSLAIVPELGLGFACVRGESCIAAIRLPALRLAQGIAVPAMPQTIANAAAAGLVYSADRDARCGLLIEPRTRALVNRMALEGGAGDVVADPGSGLLYQSLEDQSEIVAIDPRARRVVRHFELGSGAGPAGLALDAERQRLFVACANEKLIVLELEGGHVIAALPIGSGVGGVAYDATLRRIYAPSSEGRITVIEQSSADRYRVRWNVPVPADASRLALDPSTHRAYLLSRPGDHAEIVVYDAVR